MTTWLCLSASPTCKKLNFSASKIQIRSQHSKSRNSRRWYNAEKRRSLKPACTFSIWSSALRHNSDKALALFCHSHSSTLWNTVNFSAQKHQIIPGAGLLAKRNMTSKRAELTLNAGHCPLSLARLKLGMLRRKILLEKQQRQREGKRSTMLFSCFSGKLAEQLKGDLKYVRTPSHPANGRNSARQALKKLHLAKCLPKKKFKKDSVTSVEEGSKVLSLNVSGARQM